MKKFIKILCSLGGLGKLQDDIKIRKATLNDIDSIESLYDKVCDYLEENINYPKWRKGIYPCRDDAQKGIDEDVLYIAVLNDTIVGTFMLRHEPENGYSNIKWSTEDDYSKIYVIYTLIVNPDYMKLGIGKLIMDYIYKLAVNDGCISIRLDVAQGNIPAENLYKKSGYEYKGTTSLGYEEYDIPWFNLYERVL